MTTDNEAAEIAATTITSEEWAKLKAWINVDREFVNETEKGFERRGFINIVRIDHRRHQNILTGFGKQVLATRETAAGSETDEELADKILWLLGVDSGDWSSSLSGIYTAIRSNMQIGEPHMSKVEDWTDANEITEDTLTAVMFKLVERAQKAEAQLQASEDTVRGLRETLRLCHDIAQGAVNHIQYRKLTELDIEYITRAFKLIGNRTVQTRALEPGGEEELIEHIIAKQNVWVASIWTGEKTIIEVQASYAPREEWIASNFGVTLHWLEKGDALEFKHIAKESDPYRRLVKDYPEYFEFVP